MHVDSLEEMATKTPRWQFIREEFFYESGFKMPVEPQDFLAKKPIKSLLLALVEPGNGARIEGVRQSTAGDVVTLSVDLLLADRRMRLHLDPSKHYAVLERCEWTLSGSLRTKTTCADFETLPHSTLWLPKRVQVEWHTWNSIPDRTFEDPLIRETYKVTKLRHEAISPDQFSLMLNTLSPAT